MTNRSKTAAFAAAILMIALVFSLLLVSCGSGEPATPAGTPSVPVTNPATENYICLREGVELDPGTLYVTYLYVRSSDENGTVGDDVFVEGVTGFNEFDTARIEFYGRYCIAEERVFDYGTRENAYQITCKFVIKKVVSARRSNYEAGEPVMDKPIIYLYPAEETVCSVKLMLNGKLTCTYPEYGENGWENFVAKPDGTLVFPDGSEYYALYWEGVGYGAVFDFSRGACVAGKNTAAFLAETLPKLGLSAREANEFIIYWLPLMQDNEYNLISFQTSAYTENAALCVTPEPDTCIRVFMAFTPLDEPVDIPPQEFSAPERYGFTVVEWGGSEVGNK